MSKKATSSEMVPVKDYAVATLQPEELRRTIEMNVGSASVGALDLERIKVPTGGSTTWVYETLEGEETARELTGIVVGARDARAYWRHRPEEGTGDSPPDCRSDDGVTGVGDPGGECASCPLSQFGSDHRGRGQACKAMRFLFLVQPESMLPVLLSVPPSSLKTVRKYGLRLASRGVRLSDVVTAFGLEKASNTDGISFARVQPRMAHRLEPAEAERMAKVSEALAPLFARVEVQATDVRDPEEHGGYGPQESGGPADAGEEPPF